jgi:hypothetical protein
VHAADHEPVFIKLAKCVVVQRAHDARPQTLGQGYATPFYILLGLGQGGLQQFLRTRLQSLPKIGPFYVSMMLEIAGAAIVWTAFTGETYLSSGPVVSIFHLGIESRQVCKKVTFRHSLHHLKKERI